MVRKIILFVISALVLAVAVLLVSREYFLAQKLQSVCQSFHKRTGGNLIIRQSRFNGLRKIELNQIAIISPVNDTIVKIDSIGITVSLLKLIRLKSPLSKLEAVDVKVNFVTENDTSKFDFLFKGNKPFTPVQTKPERNYSAMINNAWSKLMDLSDVNLRLEKTTVHMVKNFYERTLYIPAMTGNNGKLNFIIECHDRLRVDKWSVKAGITEAEDKVDFTVHCLNQLPHVWIPFFDADKKPKIAFNNFSASLQKQDQENSRFHLTTTLDSLQVDYWRIASEELTLPVLSQNFFIDIDKSSITIDSSSSFTINQLNVKTFVRIEKADSNKYWLNLSFDHPSQQVFNSLPKAMFNLFDGIQTKGDLAYSLHFYIDMAKPEELIFDSGLKGKKFSISKYGKENFARINTSFLFDAYDGERYVRSFSVGPDNPDFTSLDQVNPYLQYAVLTSEDPSFFYHRGFIEEAFRESLVENIKEKRFVRGGSTISMQLVKNVFLTREKTISRKVQEALIVWLIENQRLISKERMFEIYLNVIEWGPNVYGIKQAAHFYFGKTPQQLSLAESIYLSSIIPHPKYFKYSFDKTGTLKPFLGGYYKLISNRMLSKTWITPLDTFNLKPEIQLKGDALKFILPTDSIKLDTIPDESEQDFFN